MIRKVLEYIEKNAMFQTGDKVIVAVSGGPDSMCLLHLLQQCKDELEISLVAAHVNHCLRGIEAEYDEQYVREFCAENGIEYCSRKIDIHNLSKERNISCEMAGREARYEFFQELRNSLGAKKIALAHNANDQAETLLMRIMRGTGLEGMIGIKPVRDGLYVRPILCITRKEIENYCGEKKINPRIDKSNLQDIYARNKVRLKLIPYIEENFNSDIIQVLNRLTDTVKKENEYLDEITLEKYKKYCDYEEKKVIIKEIAFLEHEAILTRLIRKGIEELVGHLTHIEKVHIYDIIALQKGGTGKKISLPNKIIAKNSYGDILISQEKEVDKKNKDRILPHFLEINAVNIVEEYKAKIESCIINSTNRATLKSNLFTQYFDLDKVKGEMYIRYRKNGDRFTALGMEGSKKLKDIFIDLKIEQEKRDGIPLICFGEEIAWIVGYKISGKYKVDSHTKNILRIKIERI